MRLTVDHAGAHPVLRAATARPQTGGEAVLLGLGRLKGVRRRAAEPLPRRVEHLVVAGRARPVRRQVLAAGLALDDRPGHRPRAAGAARPRSGGAGGKQAAELALGLAPAGARAGERGQPRAPDAGELVAAGAQAGGGARPRGAAPAPPPPPPPPPPRRAP